MFVSRHQRDAYANHKYLLQTSSKAVIVCGELLGNLFALLMLRNCDLGVDISNPELPTRHRITNMAHSEDAAPWYTQRNVMASSSFAKPCDVVSCCSQFLVVDTETSCAQLLESGIARYRVGVVMPCKCGYSTTVYNKWQLYLCVIVGRYTFVLHLALGSRLDRPMESCKETFERSRSTASADACCPTDRKC